MDKPRTRPGLKPAFRIARPLDAEAGEIGKSATKGLAERRLRFAPEVAVKLDVAAAIRGVSPSELVAIALAPYLAFELPTLPAEKGRGRSAG